MLAPTGDCGADIPDKEANAKGDVWTSGYPVVLVQSQRKPVNIIGPERNARSDAVSEPEKSRRVRRLVLGHLAGLRARLSHDLNLYPRISTCGLLSNRQAVLM
jgi:hypothetical protein